MFIDANLRFCTDQNFGGNVSTINNVEQIASDEIDLGSVGDFDIGLGNPLYLHILPTLDPSPFDGEQTGSAAYIDSITWALYHRNRPWGLSGNLAILLQETANSAYPLKIGETVIYRLNPTLGRVDGRYLRLTIRIKGTAATGGASDAVQCRLSAWISGEGPLTDTASRPQVTGWGVS
jgi:hypothetical protein